MKRRITLLLLFVGFITQSNYTYGQEEIIAKLKSSFNSNGFTVVKTETTAASKAGFKLNHKFYPGNKYSILFLPLEKGAPQAELKLLMKDNEEQVVRHVSEGEILNIQLDFTNTKKPIEGIARLSLKSDTDGYNLGLLMLGYKSGKNIDEDAKTNLSENYYSSLAGMEYLPEIKKANEEVAKNHVREVFEQNGFSISSIKTMSLLNESDSISHTFYEGNEYIIFAYSVDDLPVSMQVFQKNEWKALGESFGDLFGETPAKNSKEDFNVTDFDSNNFILDFKEEGLGSSNRGIKVASKISLPSDMVYLAIGYKSKSNATKITTNNAAEDFFIKQ